jgi:hypothetical protein
MNEKSISLRAIYPAHGQHTACYPKNQNSSVYNRAQPKRFSVDSHGQARGTKTYTLSANNKRIHSRLKAWSSAWFASL